MRDDTHRCTCGRSFTTENGLGTHWAWLRRKGVDRSKHGRYVEPFFVCVYCKDTHKVFVEDPERGESRVHMCTHCPTPCQQCRSGGNGPYCERTPCSCSCHLPVVTFHGPAFPCAKCADMAGAIRAAVAQEREACAGVAAQTATAAGDVIASAIRARKQ